MKSVLIILTRANQSDLTVNESISALMLFASFGIEISILFQDAALSLLVNSNDDPLLKQFIKPANKMVQSFEFYDIENLYVLKKDADHPLVLQSEHPLKAIEFNAAFMMQFDHMITW